MVKKKSNILKNMVVKNLSKKKRKVNILDLANSNKKKYQMGGTGYQESMKVQPPMWDGRAWTEKQRAADLRLKKRMVLVPYREELKKCKEAVEKGAIDTDHYFPPNQKKNPGIVLTSKEKFNYLRDETQIVKNEIDGLITERIALEERSREINNEQFAKQKKLERTNLQLQQFCSKSPNFEHHRIERGVAYANTSRYPIYPFKCSHCGYLYNCDYDIWRDPTDCSTKFIEPDTSKNLNRHPCNKCGNVHSIKKSVGSLGI